MFIGNSKSETVIPPKQGKDILKEQHMKFKQQKKCQEKSSQTGNRYLLRLKISCIFLAELNWYLMFTGISLLE